MLIKNKSDPIIHIRSVLERRDLNSIDKVILTSILIEPYIQVEFSPTKYSKYLGISRSGINYSIVRLKSLKILKEYKKEKLYKIKSKYTLDCKSL